MLLSWWKLLDGNNFHEGASVSTTLLYHMYNLRGYRQRSMKCVAGGMEITIEQPRERIVCPNCGERDDLPHRVLRWNFWYARR